MEQLADLGKFIGKGNTAEVYSYDENSVVKLYHERFGDELARYEYAIMQAVNISGAPCPNVIAVVKHGKRHGLKMEFINGSTFDKLLVRDTVNAAFYGAEMAKAHVKMHASNAAGLPGQESKFTERIMNVASLLGDRTDAVLKYVKLLPAGSSVCHGDLHPKNIMPGNDRTVVIDWTNAYCGNLMGDVTLACLRLQSPYVPESFKGDGQLFIAVKQVIYAAYFEAYQRLSLSSLDMDKWLLPCAAAQLSHTKPVHTKWLLNIIERQFLHLDK